MHTHRTYLYNNITMCDLSGGDVNNNTYIFIIFRSLIIYIYIIDTNINGVNNEIQFRNHRGGGYQRTSVYLY